MTKTALPRLNYQTKEGKKTRMEDLKTKIKKEEYIYVMCSTQNQMVNFIPLKHFGFKKIINLTVKGSPFFRNERWDENLKITIDGASEFIKIDPFKQSYVLKSNSIKKKLSDFLNKSEYENSPIFFNITGGQRPFVVAMKEIFEERKVKIKENKDIFCYLDGNTNKMYLETELLEEDDYNYSLTNEDLNIEKALYLSGFQNYKQKNPHSNILKGEDNEFTDKMKVYEKLHGFYQTVNATDYEAFRRCLIFSNKNPNEVKNDIGICVDKKKKYLLNKATEFNLDKKHHELLEEVLQIGLNDNKSTPFGSVIFEDYVAYLTYKVLKADKNKNVIDMALNYKINYLDEDSKNKSVVDELDILLLTKGGKLIVFECKSGSMDKEGGKSHKYTTYAISGVFGTPILISPLKKSEILKSDDMLKREIKNSIQNQEKKTKEEIEKELKEKKKKIKSHTEKMEEIYENILKTAGYGIRANLEVWGIDEIETKLQELLK